MIFVASAPDLPGGESGEIDTSRQWLWQRPDRLVHRYIHISQIFHPARQTIHLYFSARGLRIYSLYIGYSRQTVF